LRGRDQVSGLLRRTDKCGQTFNPQKYKVGI